MNLPYTRSNSNSYLFPINQIGYCYLRFLIYISVGDPQEFAIADPCPYHVKYSPDVFQKKTKNLATYNTDKSCFDNFYVK